MWIYSNIKGGSKNGTNNEETENHLVKNIGVYAVFCANFYGVTRFYHS